MKSYKQAYNLDEIDWDDLTARAKEAKTFERTSTARQPKQQGQSSEENPAMRAVELSDGLYSIQFDHNPAHRVHVVELVPPSSSLRTFRCDHRDCIDMALISRQGADCPHVRTIRDAADGTIEQPLFIPDVTELDSVVILMKDTLALSDDAQRALSDLIDDAQLAEQPAIAQVAAQVFSVHVGQDNYWSRNGRVHVRVEVGRLKCKCPSGKFDTRHCHHKLLVLIACDLNGQTIAPGKPVSTFLDLLTKHTFSHLVVHHACRGQDVR